MLINGTNFTGLSQPIFGHYTMGCGGTAAFMKSVLRAVNLDHASGQVYAALKTYYTVAELEALQLWDKLATKATATNYCASASAQQPVPPAASHKLRPLASHARWPVRTS